MRSEDTRERQGLKRGRRKSGATKDKGLDKGEASDIQLKVDSEIFPNVRELLRTPNPKDLLERYGIDLDRDLPWPLGEKMTQSVRAASILETIARRWKKGGGKNE